MGENHPTSWWTLSSGRAGLFATPHQPVGAGSHGQKGRAREMLCSGNRLEPSENGCQRPALKKAFDKLGWLTKRGGTNRATGPPNQGEHQ